MHGPCAWGEAGGGGIRCDAPDNAQGGLELSNALACGLCSRLLTWWCTQHMTCGHCTALRRMGAQGEAAQGVRARQWRCTALHVPISAGNFWLACDTRQWSRHNSRGQPEACSRGWHQWAGHLITTPPPLPRPSHRHIADNGVDITPERRAAVDAMLDQLAAVGKQQMPRPLDNPLLWGNYNVIYTSASRASYDPKNCAHLGAAQLAVSCSHLGAIYPAWGGEEAARPLRTVPALCPGSAGGPHMAAAEGGPHMALTLIPPPHIFQQHAYLPPFILITQPRRRAGASAAAWAAHSSRRRASSRA